MTNKLRTAQRAMERKMLDLKLKDKIPCSEIRKRTKVIDIIEYTLKRLTVYRGFVHLDEPPVCVETIVCCVLGCGAGGGGVSGQVPCLGGVSTK